MLDHGGTTQVLLFLCSNNGRCYRQLLKIVRRGGQFVAKRIFHVQLLIKIKTTELTIRIVVNGNLINISGSDGYRILSMRPGVKNQQQGQGQHIHCQQTCPYLDFIFHNR